MATFDVLLSQAAQQFIATLDEHDRATIGRALDILAIDPIPDGVTRVYLPAPYYPGSIGFAYGDFWIYYQLLAGWRIRIGGVAWRRDPLAG